MKPRLPLLLVCGVLAGALAACGHSPPTRFFTLDAVPATTPTGVTAPAAPVQLDAVHIPPALDRPQLVTQTAPNRLGVSDQDRWGAPLGQMMRRTLAQDLQTRLPRGAFIFPDAPHPAGARALVVTVLQVTATPAGRVDMEANWSLLSAGSARPERSENLTLSAAAAPGPAGEAQALSTALGELSDHIAAAVLQG
jgi:hypothetical protein